MMKTMRLFLLVALAWGAACSSTEKDAQIVIVVETDFDVPEELNQVGFWINRVGAKAELAQEVSATLGGKLGVKLPLILTIAPDSDSSVPVEVRVEGYRVTGNPGTPPEPLVRRKARVRFQRGRTLMLRMDLVRSCAPMFLRCEKESETGTCDSNGCASSETPETSSWNGDPRRGSPVASEGGGGDGNPLDDAGTSDAGGGAVDAGQGGQDAGMDGNTSMPKERPVQLALGDKHSCVRTDRGRVFCWGLGHYGQLGDGRKDFGTTCVLRDTTDALPCSPTPVLVTNLPKASQISIGYGSSCAVHEARPNFGGNVSCWGDLREGSTVTKATPLVFDDVNIANALEISVGPHICIRRRDLLPICFGQHQYGQLGNESTAYVGEVVVASGLSGLVTPAEVRQLAVGDRHTCLVKTSGELVCWGANENGQAGQPLTSKLVLKPALVTGATNVGRVFASGAQTCFSVAGEGAYCFGDDVWAQLGSNQEGSSPCGDFGRCTPAPIRVRTDVIGGGEVVQLTGGTYFMCARFGDGRVACWGNNEVGQLGPEIVTTVRKVPVAMPAPLDQVKDVAAGDTHACAIVSDDGIVCWGLNDSGQLGASPQDVAQTATPIRVPLTLP